MSNFVSVSTSAARIQDLSINPQKLAGQCGKLKCCLNFEVDAYVEAQRSLPSREIELETKELTSDHFKTAIFSGMRTDSTDKVNGENLVTIHKDRVFEVIEMNKKGKKPTKLSNQPSTLSNEITYQDNLLDGSITRFDKKKQSSSRKRRKPRRRRSGNSGKRRRKSNRNSRNANLSGKKNE